MVVMFVKIANNIGRIPTFYLLLIILFIGFILTERLQNYDFQKGPLLCLRSGATDDNSRRELFIRTKNEDNESFPQTLNGVKRVIMTHQLAHKDSEKC